MTWFLTITLIIAHAAAVVGGWILHYRFGSRVSGAVTALKG